VRQSHFSATVWTGLKGSVAADMYSVNGTVTGIASGEIYENFRKD